MGEEVAHTCVKCGLLWAEAPEESLYKNRCPRCGVLVLTEREKALGQLRDAEQEAKTGAPAT